MGETAAGARDLSAAVFLDRDGTIIRDCHYLSDPAGVELIPGAAAALRRLQEAGYLLAIVSNQSGVGRGYFTFADLERVNARLRDLLAIEHVELQGVYVCPHRPDEDCRCRKPRPGLIERAAADLGADLSRSYMVGDKPSDVEAGSSAGVRSFLIGADERTLADIAALICENDVDGATPIARRPS